jgi:hypothetical protein
MQVLVFSTSVKSIEEVNLLKPFIDSLVGKNNWNFALDDCDHILRIANEKVAANHAMALLHSKGYQCQELE